MLHRDNDRILRWLVVVLASLAVGVYGVSLFEDWWQIWLFAPQYPAGLHLQIRLTGVGGDAREIDMLNHYIGMGHLDQAAMIERQVAGWAIGLIGLVAMMMTFFTGKRGHWLLVTTGLLLPVGFIADSFAWMWWYGHHLNPKAPLHIAAFTPQLFGQGSIGQFQTYGRPQTGFALALAATAMLAVAALIRWRVCRDCALAEHCGATCPAHFVGKQPDQHGGHESPHVDKNKLVTSIGGRHV